MRWSLLLFCVWGSSWVSAQTFEWKGGKCTWVTESPDDPTTGYLTHGDYCTVDDYEAIKAIWLDFVAHCRSKYGVDILTYRDVPCLAMPRLVTVFESDGTTYDMIVIADCASWSDFQDSTVPNWLAFYLLIDLQLSLIHI